MSKCKKHSLKTCNGKTYCTDCDYFVKTDPKRVFAVYCDGALQRHESGENRLTAWSKAYERAVSDVAMGSNKFNHEEIEKEAKKYSVIELVER